MSRAVPQRTLAGTDLAVGRIVLGTMTFGTQVDEAEATAMVRTCREAGITMFDTSNNYGAGAAEQMLGRIVRPFRDEVVLATKFGSPVDQSDPEATGLSRRAVRRAVDDSLRRLGVDHIDVYYMHRPDRDTPVEETLEALDEVVRQGKVRYLGQSNFAAWQITEMLHLARANGWTEPLVSQPLYNLLGRRVEAEYAACSARFGLTNVTYNPLAGGLLTGKHRRDGWPEAGTRFSKSLYRDRYWNDAQFDAVERLGEVAAGAGLTLVEMAFRWVLGRPLTDCMLLGASGVDQLRKNLDAVSGPDLAPDVLAACDDVWRGLEGVAPHYNR
ncbi:aldo/keto reductase [Pseudonocardia kunmingensis]|uniref:Aryl-alcohol dehydrogenase-like predicted oxidoreductase n=1 Tax=Pseudonocardia kunmingensis TaxID=630975 RepID=A0A543DVE1_9PSEU|nr:aldo/keto reductase [Pseudonocardia kunmingensis]TQM13294.1 aryl-alcohol dehydrogenase-like predicted oxidoreductase [Pseudonocardia kunmingensis]